MLHPYIQSAFLLANPSNNLDNTAEMWYTMGNQTRSPEPKGDPMLPIIPLPRARRMTDARVILPATVSTAAFPDAQKTLTDFARRTHGITLTEAEDAAITVVHDPALPAEGYRLTVTAAGTAVAAVADALGAQNAAVTLVQLMEKAADGLTLPVGELTDAPECSWRGIMIDLARDWHEPHVLYEYIDLCRFYKIKYLHLHFTDDQSYTLPSRAFPKLSTEGRHYTEEELRGLIAYAKSRGVELIPEIDVPGHATSFAAYGDLFGSDGIICLSDESIAAMKVLFSELCALFSDSEYIHIGGDEAAIAKWTTCEKCLSAFKDRGVDTDMEDKRHLAEIMYATFIREMCEAVLQCGKTPVVWEGFAAEMNHMIPREAVIMSWENFYQTTPELQAAGFRLINCSWSPMYVVTPVVYWKPEEVYGWSPYKWRPVHPGSPYLHTGLEIEPTMQVEGGQLLAWGDHIMKNYPNVAEGVREEQRLIEERTPALAEGTWHREKPTDWAEFEPRMKAVAALYERFRTNA